MKIKLFVFMLFLGAAVFMLNFHFEVIAAEESHPSNTLTFKEFYQKVLVYYPKLKQQDCGVNAAIARKLEAVSGFLPRVQGIVSATRGDDPVFVFGSLLRENAFTQDNFALSSLNKPNLHTTYNVSLQGQMPIFDAFQTISRVKLAKLAIDSAKFEGSLTKMEAFLLAAESYLRAIAVDKMLATVNEVNQASEEDIKQADELKDKGLILGADFYAAKVMHGSIIQLKNQLLQEKQAAHILINILMGDDPLNLFEIKSEAADITQDNSQLQNWFEQAYKLRPEIAAVDKMIQAQDIEVSREKSTILPKVDAFAQVGQNTNSLKSGGGRDYTVGIKGQMDLFDPSYSARVNVSREALKKLESDRMILKDEITKDLTNEYVHYKTSQDNLPVTKKMVDDAKQAVDLMVPLYREGRKSIADLFQIRAVYLNVAQGYYTLAADSKASLTRLLFLSGQLDDQRLNDVINTIGG